MTTIRTALAAGFLASALAVGAGVPAAEAAPTLHISGGWKIAGTDLTSVGGRRAAIVVTTVDTRLVKVDDATRDTSAEYAYRRYRLVLRALRGHVYYNHVLSPWRAILMQKALAQPGNLRTEVDTTGSARYTHFSVGGVQKLLRHYQTSAVAEIRAENTAYNIRYSLEDNILYGQKDAGGVYDAIHAWASKLTTYPSTWQDYTGARSGITEDGHRFTVTGSPRNFTVTAWVQPGTWVRLKNGKYMGAYAPLASASANSALVLDYWKWTNANLL